MTAERGWLTPVETATGIVLGDGADPGPLPAVPAGETPLAALERACLPALERGRCCVSFSGGRDSSIVLATAARVARREGLPLPLPVTNRFPLAGHTDESRWQELVVRNLGLDDWVRIDHTDALDIVGPVATQALARHGLLWPFNAHFHVPLLEASEGGTLLTGIGGDELFGSSRWSRAASVLRLRESPRPRDLARIALLASPRPLRRNALARRFPGELFPWLTVQARRELARAWAADEASEPLRVPARIRKLRGRRWAEIGLRSLELLAVDAGAQVAHPLLSRDFGAAVAAAGGRLGFENRTSALLALFGELLPAEVLWRSSKACFDSAFWTDHSRRFAQEWSGEGVDRSVVDPEALRSAWSKPEPDAHTYLLLQALWVTRNEGSKNGHLDVSGVAGGARGAYAVQ
jgi:asparagine synthase (glutamine-hydrolysing)